jgi:MFS family permease
VAATALVLLLTWGGGQYAWGSPQILILGVITVLATAAFLAIEARAAEPVLPLHVFRNLNFSLATAMSFLLGLALFGALTFLPLYQQTVQHASATTSGLLLIPLLLGSTATSIIGGQITTKTGRYKALPIAGGAIMTFAMYMLTHLGPDTSRLTSGIYFAILGIGMGFLMQITTLIVQNSVEPKDMGVASSSRTFFQQIGGSIGVSLFGVIFTRRLTESLRAQLPGVHLHTSNGQLDPATINQLPALIRHAAFVGISHGIDGVFIWAVPTAALVFVLAWLVKEIPLRGRSESPAEPVTPSSESQLVG